MSSNIKDVAALSGVSIATVSRVLNGKPGIRVVTIDKVLRAVKDLNYHPDHIARSMITKKTNTIGLVIADITNPFYAHASKIIERIARLNNFCLIICNTDNRSSIQKKTIEMLRQKNVDGIIFASTSLNDKPVRELVQENFPCIMYHRKLQNKEGNSVGPYNKKGVEIAMRHLYELGHRRIGFISGPIIFSTGMERLRGYLNSCKEFDLDQAPYLIQEGGYKIEQTTDAVKKLLHLPEPPTAIFASNDFMALQVMDVILKEGYNIPEDFSIIGFDNIPITAHERIQLTTIDTKTSETAKLVIENLINIINRKPEPTKTVKILVEPSLIKRGSTGPVKKN